MIDEKSTQTASNADTPRHRLIDANDLSDSFFIKQGQKLLDRGANFCDFYSLKKDGSAAKDRAAELRAAAEALFKKS